MIARPRAASFSRRRCLGAETFRVHAARTSSHCKRKVAENLQSKFLHNKIWKLRSQLKLKGSSSGVSFRRLGRLGIRNELGGTGRASRASDGGESTSASSAANVLGILVGTAAVLAVFQFGDAQNKPELSGLASTLFPVLSFARHILTALVAGGTGAAVVYPVDVVKTRLQSQDSKVQIYDGPVDCLRKIFRDEGLKGLYAGIVPQVLGVAPEKGLKVSVYSSLLPLFVASPLASYGWVLPVTAAGFSAGACQVAVTNPLEVTKIRLQMQNIDEPDRSKHKSVIEICQELGFSGLYQLSLTRNPFRMV
ncbi:hypothetical protein CYMTET_50772 [Cymbomonas tetramitiformis]|uniref:Uncharacterized protein n=1 Tax=Cymbomonas tetramitiformis TaxID=36881 RepID=A0AAE0BP30_9CHLO|nr:hypothetical protein CYMTET_50772 [Cymbomonas tetramitiformis]